MKKSAVLFAALIAAGCAAAPQLAPPPAIVTPQPSLPAQWVQLGEGGTAEVRAVVENTASGCPQWTAGDGSRIQLTPRAPADDKFALLCGAMLPKPTLNPQRIVVLGDTGCRLLGQAI